MLKAAQSPLSGNNQIQRPKSGRKALLPKNPSATTPIITPQKVKPTKPTAAEWTDIPLVDNGVNKENIHVHHPLFVATSVKNDPVKIEDFDLSLAEELSAIREKRERLKRDKEKTEEMLQERDLLLDMQMKELRNRGEKQKLLEMEVDRLYRLNQLKLSCMSISPIQSLREKEMGKGKGMRINHGHEVVKGEGSSETNEIQKQIKTEETECLQPVRATLLT